LEVRAEVWEGGGHEQRGPREEELPAEPRVVPDEGRRGGRREDAEEEPMAPEEVVEEAGDLRPHDLLAERKREEEEARVPRQQHRYDDARHGRDACARERYRPPPAP